MDIFEWEESIPVTANNLNEMQNTLNDNISDNFQSNGKILWEGTFSTGELTVTGISNYSLIGIYVENVLMIGNQLYGGLAFRTYKATTISMYGYRFTYDSANEVLRTDTDNPGASNGSSQLTITKIIGIV